MWCDTSEIASIGTPAAIRPMTGSSVAGLSTMVRAPRGIAGRKLAPRS